MYIHRENWPKNWNIFIMKSRPGNRITQVYKSQNYTNAKSSSSKCTQLPIITILIPLQRQPSTGVWTLIPTQAFVNSRVPIFEGTITQILIKLLDRTIHSERSVQSKWVVHLTLNLLMNFKHVVQSIIHTGNFIFFFSFFSPITLTSP